MKEADGERGGGVIGPSSESSGGGDAMPAKCCPHCGDKLPPVQDAFCGACGEALPEPEPTPPPVKEQKTVQAPVEQEARPDPSSGVVDQGYRFCEQCGAPSSHLELRSNRMVALSLCPACARAYDTIGRSLVNGLCWLLLGVVLFALVCWLIG
jgi:hypothetical protein